LQASKVVETNIFKRFWTGTTPLIAILKVKDCVQESQAESSVVLEGRQA